MTDLMVEWGYSIEWLETLDIGELHRRYKIAEARRAAQRERERQATKRRRR